MKPVNQLPILCKKMQLKITQQTLMERRLRTITHLVKQVSMLLNNGMTQTIKMVYANQ